MCWTLTGASGGYTSLRCGLGSYRTLVDKPLAPQQLASDRRDAIPQFISMAQWLSKRSDSSHRRATCKASVMNLVHSDAGRETRPEFATLPCHRFKPDYLFPWIGVTASA